MKLKIETDKATKGPQVTIQFESDEDLMYFTKYAVKVKEQEGTVSGIYCGLMCSALRRAKVQPGASPEHAALLAVAEAAKVIQLDSKISAWLELNDPQANIQLHKALAQLAAVRNGGAK